jgi:hypothetical protein
LLREDIPKAALAWTYKKGKHLVIPEKEKSLPSQMRKLHAWYIAFVKAKREMLLVKVRNEELFQLLNKDALDKCLVS